MGQNSRQVQDSPEAVFRRQILERVSLALGTLIVLGVGARYLSAPVKIPQVIVALSLAGLVFLTPALTRRLKRAGLAAAPVCGALLLLIAGAGWKHGGLYAPVASLLPMLPLIAFCFGGKRLATVVLGGSLVVIFGLFLLGAPEMRNHAIVSSVLAVAAFVIGSVYERSRRIAEQHLVEASWDPLESTCRHASLSIL